MPSVRRIAASTSGLPFELTFQARSGAVEQFADGEIGSSRIASRRCLVEQLVEHEVARWPRPDSSRDSFPPLPGHSDEPREHGQPTEQRTGRPVEGCGGTTSRRASPRRPVEPGSALPRCQRVRSSARARRLGYRRCGSFSRHFRQMISRSRGTRGFSREGGSGELHRGPWSSVSARLVPVNGARPVSRA